MTNLRRLAGVTALLIYALIVLGGFVRISGSGMGCGDHWPLCNGRLIPSLSDIETLIEWGHRLVALLVSVLVAATAVMALALRKGPGVAGKGGPLRPALLAVALLIVQVMLGAVTVWLELPPASVIMHLGVAMGLLASVMVTALRSGEHGISGHTVPRKTHRGIVITAAMAAVTLLLGGLTANLHAGPACQGFPFCNGEIWPSSGGNPLIHIHWTHRLLAYGLFAHAIMIAVKMRGTALPVPVRRWTAAMAATVVLQVLVAAAMVWLHLPPVWRAAHVAAGTAIWVCAVFAWWYSAQGVENTA